MTIFSNLFRAPAHDGTREQKKAERRVARAPRTQDEMMVVAAQDNVLILRNFSVVGAVALESVDDSLLSPEEIEAHMTSYREDLLKRIRFDFQILIGTRPQRLDPLYETMQRNAERWEEAAERIERLIKGLEPFLTGTAARDKAPSDEEFRQAFGFTALDLTGVPGDAREVARLLTDEQLGAQWRQASDEQRAKMVRWMIRECEASLRWVEHLLDLIYERAAFVQQATQRLQAPVRTIYFVVSYQARVIGRSMSRAPLSESELRAAIDAVDERCGQIMRGLQRMKLRARRATHQELLDDVRHFYNPAQAHLSRRAEGAKTDR